MKVFENGKRKAWSLKCKTLRMSFILNVRGWVKYESVLWWISLDGEIRFELNAGWNGHVENPPNSRSN